MRVLLVIAWCFGLLLAVLSGTALVVWDLTATNKAELWRAETGSTGFLTLWLAVMILYIDLVWRQRTSGASQPASQVRGDALLGWLLVAASVVICATGVERYRASLPVEQARSIPLGVIRVGVGGLVLAFGACLLREGARRRHMEDQAEFDSVRARNQPQAAAPVRLTGADPAPAFTSRS